MTKKSFFKKNLGFFSKTVFVTNILCVLCLFISYSASFINPETLWPIAFFGLAYLPLLIINLGFVAYWLLRRPRYMFLSLIAIILGWNLLTQHFKFDLSTAAISYENDSTFRVMSYNVHLFEPAIGSESDNIQKETLKIVKDIQPDIICFQEFYSKIKGSNIFAEELKQACSFNDYYFAPASKNKYEAYGQAIFSKYPIVHSGSISQYEYGINRIIYVDVLKEKDTIRVYNVHLRSFALQSEDKEFIQNPSVSGSTSSDDGQITKRVSRKLKEAFTHRSAQAQALKHHIDSLSASRTHIVMGDFNDTPMSYSVNKIGKNMSNAFQQKGVGWGVTHFEMLPLFQIDYILCDKNLEVKSYQIIKRKLSDHYPIWSDLRIL